jgi:hypothetical protein
MFKIEFNSDFILGVCIVMLVLGVGSLVASVVTISSIHSVKADMCAMENGYVQRVEDNSTVWVKADTKAEVAKPKSNEDVKAAINELKAMGFAE